MFLRLHEAAPLKTQHSPLFNRSPIVPAPCAGTFHSSPCPYCAYVLPAAAFQQTQHGSVGRSLLLLCPACCIASADHQDILFVWFSFLLGLACSYAPANLTRPSVCLVPFVNAPYVQLRPADSPRPTDGPEKNPTHCLQLRPCRSHTKYKLFSPYCSCVLPAAASLQTQQFQSLSGPYYSCILSAATVYPGSRV